MFSGKVQKYSSWLSGWVRASVVSLGFLALLASGAQALERAPEMAGEVAQPQIMLAQKSAPQLAEKATSSTPKQAATEVKSQPLSQKALGMRAYARLQVLIEYYFMESGLYPVSLKALEHNFNVGLPADAPKVTLGDDPLSGQPFVYNVSKDRRHYTLALPEPAKYGQDIPSLETIDWGWLLLAAEGKRIERLLSDCTRSINELATACEIYAKDHNKAFPAKLEALRPQYMARQLRCPASGKTYIYVFRRGGYTIECPDAHKHGLGGLKYDSDKGLLITGGGSDNAQNLEAEKKPETKSAPEKPDNIKQ